MKIEKINNLFRQLANWILRHRLVVGALFALLVAFSLVGAKRIVIRTSFDDYFLSDDPILLKTNEFKSIFGNDNRRGVMKRQVSNTASRLIDVLRPIACMGTMFMERNVIMAATVVSAESDTPQPVSPIASMMDCLRLPVSTKRVLKKLYRWML